MYDKFKKPVTNKDTMKKLLLIWLAVNTLQAHEQSGWVFDSIVKEGFSQVPAISRHVVTQEGRLEIMRNRAAERLNQIMFNRALRGIAPYEVQTSRYYQKDLKSVSASCVVKSDSPLYEIKNHQLTVMASGIAAYEMVLVEGAIAPEKVPYFEYDRLHDICLITLMLQEQKNIFDQSTLIETALMLQETDPLWSARKEQDPSAYTLIKDLL